MVMIPAVLLVMDMVMVVMVTVVVMAMTGHIKDWSYTRHVMCKTGLTHVWFYKILI